MVARPGRSAVGARQSAGHCRDFRRREPLRGPNPWEETPADRALSRQAAGVNSHGKVKKSRMKRISADAYQGLREALAVIVWNKRPFETYLRAALRDSPDLLSGLPFGEPKRVVADLLVDRLMADEGRFQDVTLNLMLEIASMTAFPKCVQQLGRHEDKEVYMT
jgi:hypothetical protein